LKNKKGVFHKVMILIGSQNFWRDLAKLCVETLSENQTGEAKHLKNGPKAARKLHKYIKVKEY
jgi:hypothetical protein